ncbi:unnamed protein product [Lasius platythorax]|uniref:Regulatory protein zeste n=1 Tax=Lasius platythorax TaxID=488582 RepID=A0AAV2NF40_9HYME
MITQEYNESSLIYNKRDVSQLKKYWSNLKQQNKNILTAERQARFLTGGGPEKNVGEVDSDVLDIIPSLMTTAPTMSSSNFTRNESTDRQKQIFKAVKQNNITTLNKFDNEHLKKTPVPSTSSCSQHESASDLNQNIIIIDRDDEETQYAIVHVEDIEDNIQKAPNNQSDVDY